MLPFLTFTPVPLKPRHDGWTPELQLRFIAGLARGRSVEDSARRVGKTRTTAYELRKKPGAESFAAAWDEALLFAKQQRLAARQAAPPPARVIPALTDRRSAEAVLDRLYPGWRGAAARGLPKAGKASKAAKADGVGRQ
jgi:hypothetical protein